MSKRTDFVRTFTHRPPRPWLLAEWALVPLRLFLGVTFTFAGLQKLANPNFFNPHSPISIQQQLAGSARLSPLHALLVHLTGLAKPIGISMAFAEIAIGLGVLLGVWTRVVAIFGAIISFSLFLTVSFHASPYFTGSDIVFFFAWLPFVVSGGGTRLSLDAVIANAAHRRGGAPLPEAVAIPFSTVQSICGNFDNGRCRAQGGANCAPTGCPVLRGPRPSLLERDGRDGVDRRTALLGAATAGAGVASALVLGGFVADLGKLIGNAPAPTSSSALNGSTTTTAGATNPSGTLLGAASRVPIGSAASFSYGPQGDPGIVLHLAANEWVAYSAVCPHAGCTVGYSSSAKLLVCPCHGSEFQPATGDHVAGPAPHGLTRLRVTEKANGNLYLQ